MATRHLPAPTCYSSSTATAFPRWPRSSEFSSGRRATVGSRSDETGHMQNVRARAQFFLGAARGPFPRSRKLSTRFDIAAWSFCSGLAGLLPCVWLYARAMSTRSESEWPKRGAAALDENTAMQWGSGQTDVATGPIGAVRGHVTVIASAKGFPQPQELDDDLHRNQAEGRFHSGSRPPGRRPRPLRAC